MAVISLRRLSAAVLAAFLLAGAGCGSASPSAATIKFPKKAVAAGATAGEGEGSATTASTAEVQYGDTVTIDRSEFERELKTLSDNKQLQAGENGVSGAGKHTIDTRLTATWLNFIIQDRIITHEFDQRRLKVTPVHIEEAKAQLSAQFRSDQVVNAFPKWFLDRMTERNARAVALASALSGVDFSEDSLRKYYEEHKADFSENCVSHILVRSKAEADTVLSRLKGGEDFAALAKQASADKGSAAKGGALDCSPKGAFVPEFDQAASELPVGEPSDPVQTQYGFHILLVRERKDIPYDSAKEQVRALLNAETQNAYRQFLVQGLTSARITIDKRYGTFEAPAPGQVPVVRPPTPPEPRTERSDTTPTSEPLPGEVPWTPDNPTG